MTLPDFLSIIAGFRLHMLTLHAHVDNTQGPGRHACPSTCVTQSSTHLRCLSAGCCSFSLYRNVFSKLPLPLFHCEQSSGLVTIHQKTHLRTCIPASVRLNKPEVLFLQPLAHSFPPCCPNCAWSPQAAARGHSLGALIHLHSSDGGGGFQVLGVYPSGGCARRAYICLQSACWVVCFIGDSKSGCVDNAFLIGGIFAIHSFCQLSATACHFIPVVRHHSRS